jgi:molybdate/tungstate transport system substrate-binding protein
VIRSVPRLALRLTVLLASLAGCERHPASPPPLSVFAAGSLARPLRAALDSIAATGGPVVALEIMGSREMIRSVLSLGRSPDLIISADADELEALLIPSRVSSSTTFARNRVVLAFSPRSKLSEGITPLNWIDRVLGSKLRIARTDPGRAPLGYRTQLVWKLAELEQQRPGLADALAALSPPALLRGNESDLAALLESGDADAAWCYESLARALTLKFVNLGDQIDLGSPRDSLLYRRVAVLVPGETPGDSASARGTPIRYAMAVLNNASNAIGATVLRTRLLDSASRRIMRRAGLDVLDSVRVVTRKQKLQTSQ